MSTPANRQKSTELPTSASSQATSTTTTLSVPAGPISITAVASFKSESPTSAPSLWMEAP